MRDVLTFSLIVLFLLGNPNVPTLSGQESEDVQVENPFAEGDEKKEKPKVGPNLPDELMATVVTIQGVKRSGTGFVAHFRGKLVVITNQHVVGNHTCQTIKDNGGLQLKGTKFAAASDADIAMIQLDKPRLDQAFLNLAESTETVLRKDTQIMIPGNSNGDGVITLTPGKVIDIGAKKVEVDN